MSCSVAVVIPVYNSAETLRECLRHLRQSSFPSLEIIVVDDGSTDASAQVAKEFAVTLLYTRGRQGPATARNTGASVAKGEILFFLDADVCVCPGAILRVQSSFDQDSRLDALIGSYDDSPASPGFISQYKNLMHCFVHRSARRTASTFWSGCGAIRTRVFFDRGGFDERYRRPAIEDIELGYRLIDNNKKILLDRDLQVKHLKRWSFWGLLKTDVLDRGIPWTELIFRHGRMPGDLNLQWTQRVSVVLVYLLFGIAIACAIHWRGYFLTPLVAILFWWGRIVSCWPVSNRPIASEQPSKPHWAVTLQAAAILFLAWRYQMPGIVPLIAAAFAMPFVPAGNHLREAVSFSSILFLLTCMPRGPLTIALALILLPIVILNSRFYLFLAAKRGRLFALAAIPFHLLYHFYNGISFAVGTLRWLANSAAQKANFKPNSKSLG